MTWYDSEMFCESLNSTIVVVQTQNEFDILQSYLSGVGSLWVFTYKLMFYLFNL